MNPVRDEKKNMKRPNKCEDKDNVSYGNFLSKIKYNFLITNGMKRLYTFLVSLIAASLYAGVVHAVELQVDYPAVRGEGFEGGGPLAWLKYIYFGAFAVIGVVAFASLVYAGIKWMTSRSPTGVSDAKDRIQKTLLGLLLAGASVLILQLINPDLVKLREPRLPLPEAPDRGVVLDDSDPTDPQDVSDELQKDCGAGEACGSKFYCGLYNFNEFDKGEPGYVPDIRQTCLPKGDEGDKCEANNQCLSGACTGGECAKESSTPQVPEICDLSNPNSCPFPYKCVAEGPFSSTGSCQNQTGANLTVEIHPNPTRPGVDTPILHVVTLSGGVPSSSYSVSVNDGDVNVNNGDGRNKSATLTTDSNGFGRLFNEIILNYREEGTYTVSTTISRSGAVVNTDSYTITVEGGTPNPNPSPNPEPSPTTSFPPESSSVPPLTKSPTLDGPKEVSLNTNTTITYDIIFYGNPGEKVYFTTDFGAQALTGGKDGVVSVGSAGSVSVDVPIIFRGVCSQTTTTTSSSVKIQAARGNSDGTARSPWITLDDSIKIIWPTC